MTRENFHARTAVDQDFQKGGNIVFLRRQNNGVSLQLDRKLVVELGQLGGRNDIRFHFLEQLHNVIREALRRITLIHQPALTCSVRRSMIRLASTASATVLKRPISTRLLECSDPYPRQIFMVVSLPPDTLQ